MDPFRIPVADYMSSPLVSVRAASFVDHAHRQLQDFRISALPVVDEEERVVGVISRTDVLRVGRREAGSTRSSRLLAFPARTISEFMTRDPVAVPAGTLLPEVAGKMLEHRIHRVFVEFEGAVRGVVTTRDLMRAIRDARVEDPISEVMSSPLYTVETEDPVALATERLERARVSGLVVVDGERPVGVFTQVEALEARDLAADTPTEDVMNPAILVLDAGTPLHRAAGQAASMEVRRVVVIEEDRVVGIVSGLDFARALT